MHKFEEIIKWAERFKHSLSFSDVSRTFGISKSIVHSNLVKYKETLNIKFKDEVQQNLFKNGKRLCLASTGCGKVKNIEDFYFRKDSGKYKEQCKVCRSKYDKKWRQNNADYVLEYNKKYVKENRKAISAQEKDRLRHDICFKLAKRLRSRLFSAVKTNQKTGSAIKDLGCGIKELKIHLEKQFEPGMTWDNHGLHGWHIDHIRPLASFDLTDIEQVRVACHYTNLQPLWAIDNLKKGNNVKYLR